MVGRSAPAVLAVTGGRREAANAEAGTKRRREEGNETAEPRNAAGAGTKRRREAEEGSSGSGGGGDGPVERRTRIRVWPPAVAQPHPLQRLVNACRAVFRGSLTAPPPAVVSLISRMLGTPPSLALVACSVFALHCGVDRMMRCSCVRLVSLDQRNTQMHTRSRVWLLG